MWQHLLEGDYVDETHRASVLYIEELNHSVQVLKEEIRRWTLPTIPSQKKSGHKY